MSHGWQTGLFDCFSAGRTCLHGFSLFNSITYGETHYRLTHPDDPELVNMPFCNEACLRFNMRGLFIPGACIQEMRQRTQLRRQLGISGTTTDDCLTSFFCHCCGLVQESMEAKKWQEKKGVYADRTVTQQPGRTNDMAYAQPAR